MHNTWFAPQRKSPTHRRAFHSYVFNYYPQPNTFSTCSSGTGPRTMRMPSTVVV